MPEWKKVADMTIDEVRSEYEHLTGYFEDCRSGGDGINTKESLRHRDCVERLQAAGEHASYWR